MKKFSKSFLAILLACASLLSLVACKQPEPPITLKLYEQTSASELISNYRAELSNGDIFLSRLTNAVADTEFDTMSWVEWTKTEADREVYTVTGLVGSTQEISIPAVEDKKPLAIPMGTLYVQVGTIGAVELYSTGTIPADQMVWSVYGGKVSVANGSVAAYEQGRTFVLTTYAEYLFVTEVVVFASPAPEFSISEQRVYLNQNATATLSGLKNGSTYPYVSWTSADAGIATVSESGVITARAPGKTVVSAEIHGAKYDCEVIVRGVDGDLIEWIDNGQPLYKGVTMTDAINPEKKAVIYARADEDGLWFGGYAYHEICTKTEDVWWKNTNFEVVLKQNGGQIQYYCSEGFRSSGATTFLATVPNPNATSLRDAYYSYFELHVDAEYTDLFGQCFRAGFAWKTVGDMMNIYYGGNLVQTEWWYLDGHHPKTDNEMYYIYADGIYATAKGV